MSIANRITIPSFSSITPSTEGTKSVLGATLAVFVGWITVWLIILLINAPAWIEQPSPLRETMSTLEYALFFVLGAPGGLTLYIAVATPLLMLSILNLPRGRRVIAAMAGSIAITSAFQIASNLSSAMFRVASPTSTVEPTLGYYLGAVTSGISTAIILAVGFGIFVAIPFFVSTIFSDRVIDFEHVRN